MITAARPMPRRGAAPGGLVSLLPGLLLGVVLAGHPGAGQASPDVGARLQACGACHGADGNSSQPVTPSLAGQPVVFVETQLVMIREGLRDIPVMKGLLDGISDPEITQIARHYAALPSKAAPGKRDDALFEKGRAISAASHCGSCHMPDYRGREQMPRLAGQREDYLFHSMMQFKNNLATGRDTIMAASLYALSVDDLKALAHFHAHSPP